MNRAATILLVVVVVASIIGSIQCNHPHHEPPPDDSFVDFARVHFMDKKRDEFFTLLPDVQAAIASNLNEYCKEGDCQSDVTNFTAEHVNFYGANEKEKFFEDGRFIITKLFVKTGVDKVLKKEKIDEFMRNHRNAIVEEGQVQIAYINNDLVYPPRNNIDNWVIVTVSSVFVVLLIGINLACTLKHAKIAKREFLHKVAQEKKPVVRREPNPIYLPSTNVVEEAAESKQQLLVAAAKPETSAVHSSYAPPPPQSHVVEEKQQQQQQNKMNDDNDKRTDLFLGTNNDEPSAVYPQRHHHHHHHHHHHDKSGRDDRPHSHKKKKSHNGGSGAANMAAIPSSNSSTIVGNVGSGLGSPRNITTEYQSDDEEYPVESRVQVISSRRPVKNGGGGGVMPSSNSTYTMYKNTTTGEVQIPIQRVDRFDYEPQQHQKYHPHNNIGRGSNTNVNIQSGGGGGSRGNLNSGSRRNVTTLSEYSDSKVAYRLASTEHL